MAKHNTIGKLGEDIAVLFLKKRYFQILKRNYLKVSGEIDIVAKSGPITHFIEVKTVSCENLMDVSQKSLLPEENVTREKLRRLKNIISIYITEHKVEEWSFDTCAVFVDMTNKKSQVRFLENQLLPE